MAELLQPRGDPETRALKVPPHSIEAEQSVLGGVLLDKDAWLKVAERLRAEDFYRNDHRLIFEAIAALDAEGKPFDIVTVAEWLENHRRLEEAGGLAYLASLVENTPSASNIGAYVDIVRKRSILRQLIRATTEISETVFNPQGRSSEEILDYAEQTVFQIAEQESRGRKGYRVIRELLAAAIDRVDELYRKKNPITGIATGFDDLDEKTGGLQRSDLVVIAGRPSMGKAQPLDAKVLMADGTWKAMGELRPGDRLASPDGRPSRVSGLFPQGRRQAWRVTFSDGRSTECCDEHLWKVRCREWDAPRVLTTAELREKLKCARYQGRLFIDPVNGRFGHEEALPVDPYVLGLLLGDGKLSGDSVTAAAAELPDLIAERLEEARLPAAAGGYEHRVVTRGRDRAGVVPDALEESIRELGLWGVRSEAKFIPARYLQASRQARLELLRGLLGTDGCVETFGAVRFCSTSERLAQDVVDLARSLGAIATLHADDGSPAYVCSIRHVSGRDRTTRLSIESIEPTRVAEMQCISVTHPSRLYITDDYIVTHNTALAINIAEHAAIKDRCKVAIFSMEMPGEQLAMRMMASLGRIDQHRVRTGRLSDDDWPRLTASVSLMQDTKIFVDDTAALTPAELRARCRRLAREHGLDLVIVDYLQLMQVPGTVENRATEISEISRSLKAMAKELNVPVIALSQLNRSVEQRTDKRPVMSDLRECVTGDTLVCLADGTRKPIRELVGKEPWVLAMNERHHVTAARADKVWSVGRRPVFSLRLASGRTLVCTAEHRVLTGKGWKKLQDIGTGERVALARRIPVPACGPVWDEEKLILLGQLIGDGSYLKGQPMRYTTASEENSQAVTAAARALGSTVTRYPGRGKWHQLLIGGNGNRWRPAGVGKWLKEIGVFGQRSHEKRLPEEVFRLRNEQLAVLLRHLWATDGCISVRRQGTRGAHRIFFSTCSEGLALDIAALLLRFSIVARIHKTVSMNTRPLYAVDIQGAEQQLIFLQQIGAFGPRVAPAEVLKARLAELVANTNVDTLPVEALAEVKARMVEMGVSQRRMAALRGTSCGGSSHFRFAPSRVLLADYARLLNSETLRQWAEPDVFWDRVVEIVPCGEEEVFDLTVPGPANWLADSIVSHNSGAIEQDADVILFIYRDEVYDKDSPDKGKAEIIIAKQRNGPIGTVILTFLGQYTKFENYTPEDPAYMAGMH